jgi:hypothetical protein
MKTSESKVQSPFPPGAEGVVGAGAAALTFTAAPSPIFCTPETISLSPGFNPDVTT